MSTIVPRDYQHHANDALWGYFRKHKGNPLVLMPTGTGKSVVIGLFAHTALVQYPSTRILVITHVETLVSQNAEKLRRMWPNAPIGIHSASLGQRDRFNQIIFGSIQSMYRLPHAFGSVDIVIVDEAHLIGNKEETMYQAFFAALKLNNPLLKIVGFTATDWRLGTGRLTNGNIFTDIAIDMTTPASWIWFVDNGYLAPLWSKQTNLRLSEEGLRRVGGDYNLGQQQDMLDQDDINQRAIAEMVERGRDRQRWLLFATGIQHCEHLAAMLEDHGIAAVAIHSKQKDAAQRIEDFKLGKYRAAVNMNKLTTGVDCPEVDLIGILRFTDSSSLHVQMLGRGARPLYGSGFDLGTVAGRLGAMAASDKPDGCLVLDFAHNTERLGPVNNPVIKEPKQGKKGGGAAPVRVCPQCAEYVHASKPACPHCGYAFGTVVHIHGAASNAEVMVRDVQPDPVVEKIKVEHVTYAYFKRRNSDRPACLRISYYVSGMLRKFEEYISFEDPYHSARALNWWQDRMPRDWPSSTPAPADTLQALEIANRLRTPSVIIVWTNAPKPKVMDYEYE